MVITYIFAELTTDHRVVSVFCHDHNTRRQRSGSSQAGTERPAQIAGLSCLQLAQLAAAVVAAAQVLQHSLPDVVAGFLVKSLVKKHANKNCRRASRRCVSRFSLALGMSALLQCYDKVLQSYSTLQSCHSAQRTEQNRAMSPSINCDIMQIIPTIISTGFWPSVYRLCPR